MTLPDTRSARMPLMDGARLEMVRAVNASAPRSNARLFLMMRRVLDVPGPVSMQGTLDKFRQMPGDFLVLLNAIPTQVRNSLILGTLAYDVCRGDDQRLYNGEHQGVYAVGIGVYRDNVRTGEFLNGAELEQLARAVEGYCRAWRAWRDRGSLAAMSAAERGFAEEAKRIDAVYNRGRKDGRPRLVDNDTIMEKALRYAAQLRRRADPSLDPTRTVYQRQSPIYVGCTAKSINVRTSAHDKDSGLLSTSPLLALTLSCIKAVLGLDPHSVTVPVLHTWRPTQLQIGEQLVTGLASSFAWQGGLNIVQGGGHVGTASPQAETYMLSQPYLADNARATMAEFEANRLLLDCLRALQPVRDGAVHDLLARLESTVDSCVRIAAEYQAKREQLAAELRDLKAQLDVLARQAVALDQARQVIHKHRRSGSGGSGGNASAEVRRTPGYSSDMNE